MKNYKNITTYVERNNTFYIVQDGEHTLAINSLYVDSEGKLITALTGVQMHATTHGAEDCINQIHREFIIKDYMKAGYDEIAAVMLTFGNSEEEALAASRKAKELGIA